VVRDMEKKSREIKKQLSPVLQKGRMNFRAARDLEDTKIKIKCGPFFLEPNQHTVFSLHQSESF
jgi:hypothetical protein